MYYVFLITLVLHYNILYLPKLPLTITVLNFLDNSFVDLLSDYLLNYKYVLTESE